MSLFSFPQRRQDDVDNVQPIVQIFPETPFLHQLAEIGVGSGDDANVNLHNSAEPRGMNSRSWITLRSFDCVSATHIADLIKEDRAAVGNLEVPLLRCIGAGECSLYVSE